MSGDRTVTVIAPGADGNCAAIRTQGNAVSRLVADSFTIKIAANLCPGAVNIALNSYLSGFVTVAIVVISADGDRSAVGT